MIPILFIVSALTAQTCNTINFKCDKLPKECIKESPCGPRILFLPRSQGSNTARRLAGWHEYMPTCDDKAWGDLSLTLEYTHSFRGERLAQYLFGSTQLRFSGSQVTERGSRDLLADYFGLPVDFQGTIAFNPRIDNIILDLGYHLGLDAWCYGLYTKFYLPVVKTRWDLGIACHEENNLDAQDAPVFPECYMAEGAVRTASSIKQALAGEFVFGDMKQPLNFGAFPCGRKQKTRVAELDFIVGWNFHIKETSHFGIYIHTVAPTGNRPHAECIFEPIVGNGKLWEIGPGLSGHFLFYQREYSSLGIYFEGSLRHQFKNHQVRSFDLVGKGPLSRYLLLKEFTDKNTYGGTIINAIDFATRDARVGDSVKFDGSIKCSYYCNRFGVDIGYNLYARSKEKLQIVDDLFPSDYNNRRFGVKGTEGVCYTFQENGTTKKEKLNSTQNQATIKTGADVDNPKSIQKTNPRTWDNKTAVESDPPIILVTDCLDVQSGAVPHQLTHKVFAHISYTAPETRCCWQPQVGIGAEVEFDGRSKIMSSLNQWGIWFKGSLAF